MTDYKTVPEALEHIESIFFSGITNIASGFHLFERILETDKVVHDLSVDMCVEAVTRKVFERLKELSKKEIDEKFENPVDTALATYAWLLLSKNYRKQEVIDLINNSQNLFWAKEVLWQHTNSQTSSAAE